MAVKDTSVNLVIRARNEADRAINTVTDAVEKLLNTTEQGGSKVAALTNSLLSIDKAAAAIASAADRGEAAFDKLGNQIAGKRADLEGLKAEAAAAATALAKLNAGDAVVAAGRDQSGRLAQVKTVEAAYESLQSKIARLSASLAADETRLNGSRSALQQLGSTAIAAANGQAQLRAEVELETAALARQAVEAERVTEIQARINALTGVNRPATFDGATASKSAEILAEAAARDQLIQKYRQQAAEARDLAAAEAAEAANRRRFGITDNPGGNQARQSAAVFEEQARAADEAVRAEHQLEDAAEAVRAELNPLAALQERFNQKLRETNALYAQGKLSATELTARTTQLGQQLERAKVDMKRNGGTEIGLFGLRPYEITNLGYQINDLVTQVASGTSIFQALAQQGGQILQILPGIGSGLIALATNPFFLVGAAAVGAIALGFKELGDQVARLRDFDAALTGIANGADYTAAALEKNVKVAQRYGTAATDATAALKVFIREGLAPERLADFTKTAQDMVDVLGIKVPDAAKQLADGFTGGYAAIVKLDEATRFLTTTQREQIRALFEEGRAQDARTLAYEIFAGKQDDAAAKARGPWASAIRELGVAWREFLEYLSDSAVIKATAGALESLARGVTQVLRSLRNADEIQALTNKIKTLQAQLADLYGGGVPVSDPRIKKLAADIDALVKKRDALISGAGSATSGTGDPLSDGANTDNAKRRADRLAEIETQRQADRQAKLAGARRVEQAGDLAFQAEMRRSGDAIIAQKELELAVSREQKKVDAEIAEKAARRLREGQTSMGASKNLIMEREGFRPKAYWDVNAYRVGYGSDTATNANGSVSKVTRNTTTTLERAEADLERRIKEFQDVIKRQIGSERFSAFSPQQQAALTSVAYNYGSLPQRIVDAVKNGTQDQITGAIRGLGGDNNGINRGRRNREADLFNAAPNTEIDAYNDQQADKRQEKQDAYNRSLDDEIRKRREAADALQIDGALTGDKLLDARKAREISNALNDERRKAREAGVAEDDSAFAARLETLGDQLDREIELRQQKQRQQNKIDAVEKPIDDLVAQRTSLQDQLEAAQRTGDINLSGRLEEQLVATNDQLSAAIDKAIAFWEALGGPEADRAIEKLRGVKVTIGETSTQFLMTGKQINETFANGITNALDRFAQNVAEGKNVFKSLRDAFLGFAADFLRQIVLMIAKQAIFNAIGGASGSGGIGGGIAGTIGGLFSSNGGNTGIAGRQFHTGGIVGRDGGQYRTIDPAWFSRAVLRYHTGGVAGLRPNEVPAILERNEEVLTRADPRHRANGGLAGGRQSSGSGVKVVNVFDAGAAVEEALRTPAGEQAILNHVRNNPQAWKAAMG